MPGLKVGRPATLRSGPWKGVFDTPDPYDADPSYLVDLRNALILDAADRSGAYARPGWRLLNPDTPLHADGASLRGQAIYAHTMLDGSTINFCVDGGKLFRADATYTTFTDVSPAGIAIDSTPTTRVYFASLIGTLFVTDGVNRPWIASNLTSSPITGTYIDYDGHGVAWNTVGQPVQYEGGIIVALNSVGGVSRRVDISWCKAGDLALGWEQANYDNNWTLTQNEAGPINALCATNTALFYFRERSIGSATGSDLISLQSTATEDAIAFNVGAQASQLIQKFGNAIFFGDGTGRPYRLQPGLPPEPTWQQCRKVVSEATTAFPNTTAIVATSAIETTYNRYVAAIWSPTPSVQAPATEMLVFDAASGTYNGRWTITAPDGPCAIECIGNFTDASGRTTLIAIGSKDAAPASGGYVWALSGSASGSEDLMIESRGAVLATEELRTITTEGTAANWQDNGVRPDIFIQTDRLGYADDIVLNADTATIITGTSAVCEVLAGSTATQPFTAGYPVPSASYDETYRLVVGFDGVQGRGMAITVRPQAAEEQWIVHSVAVRVVPSQAGPDEA